MDCDTTGIEPDFALVKFKKLAGGGYFKIINQAIPTALAPPRLRARGDRRHRRLRRRARQPRRAARPSTTTRSAARLRRGDHRRIEEALPLGLRDPQRLRPLRPRARSSCKRLGLHRRRLAAWNFDLLARLGFTDEEIEAGQRVGVRHDDRRGRAAPGQAEHLPVFDCANRCGSSGTRFIRPRAHIRMMAAAQPFISGAISKTINMPAEATISRIKHAYRARLAQDAQGGGPLPRRLQAEPAAERSPSSRRRSRQLAEAVAAGDPVAAVAETMAERVVVRYQARPPPPARAPRRLHPEGRGRRAQDLPPHRRVRGRHPGRDLPRHAPRGRRLPLPHELLRHRHLARPAVRRAARGVRRRLRLHPLRAQRHGRAATTASRWPPRSSTTSSASWRSPTSSATTSPRSRPRTSDHDAVGDRRRPTTRRRGRGHDVRRRPRRRPGRSRGDDACSLRLARTVAKTGSRPRRRCRPARFMGYEGDPCPECGALTLVRNGTCLKCDSCGGTTGCS